MENDVLYLFIEKTKTMLYFTNLTYVTIEMVLFSFIVYQLIKNRKEKKGKRRDQF